MTVGFNPIILGFNLYVFLPPTNTLSQVDYPVRLTIGTESMNNEDQPALSFLRVCCYGVQAIGILIVTCLTK